MLRNKNNKKHGNYSVLQYIFKKIYGYHVSWDQSNFYQSNIL